ncbi:MAG: GNAT family N-acetyltransferase [Sphingobacteriales bacterium]|nr:MAG: GNAT family N-acetyltransferase [Sphingobacteriales bacterium]
MEKEIIVRKAVAEDAEDIWKLVHELAIFERAPQEHTVSVEQVEADLRNNLFVAFVALCNEKVAGMALCYPIYSTWKGASLYLEDIVVNENYRRNGIGSKLFSAVIQYAKDENAGRLGWQVLDWNAPAIEFYKKYNAVLDNEWITCRLTKEQLQNPLILANESI